MELVGILQNADKISYKRAHNNLYTSSFELPLDDPKTSLCNTHFIVDIFDGEVSRGKYRILDEPDSDITGEGEFIKYSLEHVIAFLLNDVIDGYLETGGEGCTTRMVLEQLLAKQTTQRWVLGQCDFDYEFQYSWENTNLLDAIFSIPTCFADAYHWTYDTDTYPWTLNLLHQDTDRSCEIRRKRNMQQIKRSKDSSALCTRLYCKGSGEGVNQLTIKEVNGGLPYIDADTVDDYGVLCSHYIDLTVTDAATLLAKGRAILEGVKHPRYTYTAKAADLSKITGLKWDEFDEGKYVHIIDEDKGLDLDAMIIEVGKDDIYGDPLDIDVTISNKSSDVSSDIEDLAKRTAITAQYSQGATNLYSQQYADNADADHPARMRVYVPNGCVKINQMLLSFEVDAFRAYEKGASAGGSSTVTSTNGGGATVTSTSGGGTTATSSSGGETTVTSDAGGSSTVTSTSGGGTTVTSASGGATTATSGGGGGTTVSSTSGGGSEKTSSSGGGTTVTSEEEVVTSSATTTGMYDSSTGSEMNSSGSSSTTLSTSESGDHTHTGPSHSHGLNDHTHSFSDDYTLNWAHTHSLTTSSTTTGGVTSYAARTVSISGTTGGNTGNTKSAGTGNTGSAGTHTHTVNAHTHNIRHYHNVTAKITIPAISITIPSHSHTVTIDDHSHSITLKDHTHAITLSGHTHDVTIKSHTHEVIIGNHSHNISIGNHSHTVTIESHSHDVSIGSHSHDVSIESHTHEIIHGIYEGETASSISIVVDGMPIPDQTDASVAELDIAAYLEKDDNGKIQRGTWHTIELIPDKLTRIEATLFVQTFVTSYSGGNY